MKLFGGNVNVGSIMTRSYNSRKGHYSCHCRVSWDRQSYEDKWKGKQNKKRNSLKFYDVLGRVEKGKKWGGWGNRDWHYDQYVEPALGSYINWKWLKGKPNAKGWIRGKYQVIRNNKLGYYYYPC